MRCASGGIGSVGMRVAIAAEALMEMRNQDALVL
jgi:hypothetical protein